MLYWLSALSDGGDFYNLFRYITFRAGGAFFTALIFGFVFGQPLINSMLTLGVVIGISVHETTLGTTVANLGFREITFPAPLFHGDTIRVETEVLERRNSKSRPTQGIVTFEQRS